MTAGLVVAGIAAATVAASPALAAPKYQTNPAGYGVTKMSGTCGDQPVTIVSNSNNSSDNGGWSAAHIYGGHTTYVPTSFTFTLFDATTNTQVFTGATTKGSGQQTGTLVCTFTQLAADSHGTPLTFQDLINAGEIPPDAVSSDMLGDRPGFTFTATVIPH